MSVGRAILTSYATNSPPSSIATKTEPIVGTAECPALETVEPPARTMATVTLQSVAALLLAPGLVLVALMARTIKAIRSAGRD